MTYASKDLSFTPVTMSPHKDDDTAAAQSARSSPGRQGRTGQDGAMQRDSGQPRAVQSRPGQRDARQAQATPTTAQARRATAVAQACRQIESADSVPTLDALAAAAGMSPFHFHRLFKAETGLTPKAYADAHRARRLREALAPRNAASVTQAAYDAGFNASSRFYEKSDTLLGMPPRRYRDGGAQENIVFAVAQCSLGALLVARSERGVCAISLGDDPEALVRELQDRFPKASLTGGDESFEQLLAQVVGFIETPALGLNLPLDIQGTAFQERVWRALCEIPAGGTVTYSELARRIGSPAAVRAVASACAANTLAVAVPCHRVIRLDGLLTGYRWGIDRKRELLRREAGVGRGKRE